MYHMTAVVNGKPRSICIHVNHVTFLLKYAKMLGVPAWVNGFGKCYTINDSGNLWIT